MTSNDSVTVAEIPWNYSWISQNELAAMACPTEPENMQYLIDENIAHVITLSPETIPPVSGFDIQWHFIPVEDLEPPTLEDILKFIEICKFCREKNESMAIHCRHGRGRTGVMAACYLIYFLQMSPKKSIEKIRRSRPGSIETSRQERIIYRFYDYLKSL